jgi:hypothetical protein
LAYGAVLNVEATTYQAVLGGKLIIDWDCHARFSLIFGADGVDMKVIIILEIKSLS